MQWVNRNFDSEIMDLKKCGGVDYNIKSVSYRTGKWAESVVNTSLIH